MISDKEINQVNADRNEDSKVKDNAESSTRFEIAAPLLEPVTTCYTDNNELIVDLPSNFNINALCAKDMRKWATHKMGLFLGEFHNNHIT